MNFRQLKQAIKQDADLWQASLVLVGAFLLAVIALLWLNARIP